jgi:branched-chain amino acid aminotransferase
LECFGSGTAVIVSGVSNIHYNGKNYPIAVNPTFNLGPISQNIRKTLLDIQEGRGEDKHGWVTRIK